MAIPESNESFPASSGSRSQASSCSSSASHGDRRHTLSSTLRSRSSGAATAATPVRLHSVQTFATNSMEGVNAPPFVSVSTTISTSSSNTPFSNATSSSDNHTPMPSPRKKTSLLFALFGGSQHEYPPKTLSTPTASTPTTIAMTPDEPDLDEIEIHSSPDGSPCKPHAYLETSSTEAVSSGKSSDTERCEVTPVILSGSIISSGRALFRPDDVSDDDSELLSSSPRRHGPHDRDSLDGRSAGRSQMPWTTRNLVSWNETSRDAHNPETPMVPKSRKQLRSRRSFRSTSFSCPVDDPDECFDDAADEEKEDAPHCHGHYSPHATVRRRRKRAVRTESKPLGSSKLFQRLLTTKYIVWLLCLIGLTSVSMIVTTNHQLSQVDMERRRQDHIAVLFHSAVGRHREATRRAVRHPPPLTATATSKLVRGATHPVHTRGAAPHTHPRTVNLNTLAQWHEAVSTPHAVHQPPPLNLSRERGHHAESHANVPLEHRFTSREQYSQEHHHHRRRHRQEEQDKQNHHEKHHHSHPHEEETRVYERAMADFVGLNLIPQVFPPPASLHVNNKASFELVDRFMYKPRAEAMLASPRIVHLGGTHLDTALPPHRLVEQYPADFTDNTQLYSVLDSGDERVATIEMRAPYVQGECVPMQKWQTTFNPSCNGMHELDISGMGDNRNEDDYKLFGMNGFWRNAWRYDSVGGHGILSDRDTVVLKTLKINHRFEDAYFENNRIDAVVLERLTASPHVINVFGFCGHSVITEYADGKRLGELADKMKKVPLARLQIARDIANGLADVHGIDGDGNATFVHLDINPANIVSIGGTLKLNDFNIGVLRRWNTTSNTPCGIPAQYPNPQWRSPEEARHERNLTEKVDVFSLGHIFFRLICGHEPWHKLEPDGMPSKEALNEKVKQGILPTFPGDVIRSSDPEIVAIRKAMLRCYTYDPVDRPSARDIALYLDNALRKLELQVEEE